MLRSRWDGWRRVRGQRVYRCAHGIEQKSKSKVERRPFQHVKFTDCKSRINLNEQEDGSQPARRQRELAESAAEESTDSSFFDSGNICLVSNFAFNDPYVKK